jgi:hypothetical protein
VKLTTDNGDAKLTEPLSNVDFQDCEAVALSICASNEWESLLNKKSEEIRAARDLEDCMVILTLFAARSMMTGWQASLLVPSAAHSPTDILGTGGTLGRLLQFPTHACTSL